MATCFSFFPMGLLMLVLGAIPNSYKTLDAYHWEAVSAEPILIDYSLEYRYQWQGVEYTSDRFHIISSVSLSSDDKQYEEIYSKLEKALESGETITAWVNPNKPSEAAIDRGFRWQKLLFLWFISLLCGLIGFYGLRSLFKSSKAPEGDAPWLANPKWRDNLIYSGARSGVSFIWIITVILLGIGILPMTSNGVHEIRLLAVFPYNVLVIACAGAAIKGTWQWWRYGASPLVLDPFPGSIGGDVGGEVHFDLAYSRSIKAEMQLTATRKDDTGDRENFKTTIVWQEDGYAQVTEKDGGTALQFRFAVSNDLPSSDISYERRRYAKSHVEWNLSVTLKTPKEDISRSYEIPVYPTGERTSTIEADTQKENPFATSHQAAHEIFPEVQHRGKETILKFPMRGRTLGMHLKLWLASVPLLLGIVALMSSSISDGSRLLFGLFGFLGLYFTCATLYHHFNSLRVQFTDNIVISERLLFGIPLRSRFVSYYDIKNVAFKLAPHTIKTETGLAEHMVYAVTDKGEVILAERIEGRRKAELVCDHLHKPTRLDERMVIK